MKLHHIGIVVEDIPSAASWYRDVFGYRQASEIIHDPIQGVSVQFWQGEDGSCIELIEPDSETSRVSKFLKERGGGLYHLCYEVDDLDKALQKLRRAKAFPVTKPEPAIAFEGRLVVFLITPQRMMVELVGPQEPSE